MSLSSRIRRIALLAGLAACATARASNPVDGLKLDFGITLSTKAPKGHSRDAVQKTPDFALVDGGKRIVPDRPGLIYHIERSDRDRILLSIPSRGIYGWAPRGAVVPYIEAEGYFTNDIETGTPTSFAHMMRAIVCQDNERFEGAFRDLAEAIRLDPRNAAALIERSILWQSQKRMDLALADINRAIEVDPRSGEAHLIRGVYHFRLKDHRAARADLDRAAELGFRSVFVGLLKGSIDLERKEVADAIEQFEKAIAIDPKSFDAHVMLGSAQLLRSKAVDAVTTFSRAIKLDPNKGAGYGGRAMAYLSLGQRKEAIQDLNRAIGIDPSRADLFRDRGQICAFEEQWEQALSDMATAIRLDPGDVEAHVARAWTLATCPETRLRDGKKAVELATRACELTKWKSARPMATLAAAFAETGNFSAAVEMQHKALELTPGQDPVHNYYAACLDRYRSRKPWHKISLLEEWGLRKYRPTGRSAPADDSVKQASGTVRGN